MVYESGAVDTRKISKAQLGYPKRLDGDAFYGSGAMLEWLVRQRGIKASLSERGLIGARCSRATMKRRVGFISLAGCFVFGDKEKRLC